MVDIGSGTWRVLVLDALYSMTIFDDLLYGIHRYDQVQDASKTDTEHMDRSRQTICFGVLAPNVFGILVAYPGPYMALPDNIR